MEAWGDGLEGNCYVRGIEGGNDTELSVVSEN